MQVSPKDTLITPVQCKSIWRQFKAETEYAVAQAISMQVFFFQCQLNEPSCLGLVLTQLWSMFMVLLDNQLMELIFLVSHTSKNQSWIQSVPLFSIFVLLDCLYHVHFVEMCLHFAFCWPNSSNLNSSWQETHRRSKNWLPPAWTILLLAILGYNEFMFLLR